MCAVLPLYVPRDNCLPITAVILRRMRSSRRNIPGEPEARGRGSHTQTLMTIVNINYSVIQVDIYLLYVGNLIVHFICTYYTNKSTGCLFALVRFLRFLMEMCCNKFTCAAHGTCCSYIYIIIMSIQCTSFLFCWPDSKEQSIVVEHLQQRRP